MPALLNRVYFPTVSLLCLLAKSDSRIANPNRVTRIPPRPPPLQYTVMQRVNFAWASVEECFPVFEAEQQGEPYLVVFIFVWDLQHGHGLNHGLHGCEDVLVDQPGEASPVLVRVSTAMDDPHLLDKSTFSTLTSS